MSGCLTVSLLTLRPWVLWFRALTRMQNARFTSKLVSLTNDAAFSLSLSTGVALHEAIDGAATDSGCLGLGT
jgi:hypothetical protein